MPPDSLRVSIGLPVYNGENYIAEALDSLLAQTYRNFELIISDNASIDRTQEICQAYVAQDRRVKYYRNEANFGVHKNWNRVFGLSSSEYFKWAAHDDLYAPDFIRTCVEVLDNDPSIVLCFSKTRIIDGGGNHIRDYDYEVDATSLKPYERLYEMLAVSHWCFQIFGVIRSQELRRTPLHGYYYGSDRNLLAELSLAGRVYEIPEFLYFRRDHPQTSAQISGGKWEFPSSYDPNRISQTRWLSMRRFYEYAASVQRTPMSITSKALCHLIIARLAVEKSIHRADRAISQLTRRVQSIRDH